MFVPLRRGAGLTLKCPPSLGVIIQHLVALSQTVWCALGASPKLWAGGPDPRLGRVVYWYKNITLSSLVKIWSLCVNCLDIHGCTQKNYSACGPILLGWGTLTPKNAHSPDVLLCQIWSLCVKRYGHKPCPLGFGAWWAP